MSDGNVSDTQHEDIVVEMRDPITYVLVVVVAPPMRMQMQIQRALRKIVEWESPNHVDFVSMWVLLVVVAVVLYSPDVSFHTQKQPCWVSWELLRTCVFGMSCWEMAAHDWSMMMIPLQ
jgi:hypothetical protein